MRLTICCAAALAACLGVLAGGVEAQERYAVGDGSSTVTISETAYQDIMGRLASLESTVDPAVDKPDGGWQEVDIISKPTIKISGRLHLDYWGIPNESELANYLDTGDVAVDPYDMVGFRRLRFGFKGNLNETMLYKIEMDFATVRDGSFKDAYFGWTELPVLQTLLIGQQKRPYGLDHLNSSRFNTFMERPYVVEGFNQDARRMGLCSYGTTEDESWNWRYGAFFMRDNQKDGVQYQNNYETEFAGRLANTIWYDEASGGRGYAHWAISGTAAFPGGGPDGRFRTRPEGRTKGKWFDTGSIAGLQTYQLVGLEGVLNVGSFSVVGEYMGVRGQRSHASDLNFGGGYVYVAYFLTGEHRPWERYSGTIGRVKPHENFFRVRDCEGGHGGGIGAWQVAVRYSHGDFSDDDIFGGVGNSVTAGLNWWWNPHAKMQFNFIYGNIGDRAAVGGAPLVAGVTSGDYTIFGTRFMCDF